MGLVIDLEGLKTIERERTAFVKSAVSCQRSPMIFKFIRNIFSGTIYVQIWENKIKVTNIKNQKTFEDVPLIAIETTPKGTKVISAIGENAKHFQNKDNCIVLNPFSHPRMLVKDFQCAEKILQHASALVHDNKFIPPSPKMVIHPLDKLEGGLTQVEYRVFRELGYGAGARDVLVYVGKELSTQNFDENEIIKLCSENGN